MLQAILSRISSVLSYEVFPKHRRASLPVFDDLLARAKRPMLRQSDLEQIHQSHKALEDALRETREFAGEVAQQLSSELERTRRRINIISDAVVDALITVTYEGNIISLNKAAETMLCQTEHALLGTNIADLRIIPPTSIGKQLREDSYSFLAHLNEYRHVNRTDEDCRELYRSFVSSNKGKATSRTHQFTLINSADQCIDIEALVTLLNPEAAAVESFVYFLVLKDVTYRNISSTQIAGLQQFQMRLLAAIPNPVFYKGEDLSIEGCNRAFAEMLEIDETKIIGRKFSELQPNEIAERYAEIDASLRDKDTQDVQTHRLTLIGAKTRRTHQVVMYSTALRTEVEFSGMLGTLIDLTELLSVQNLQTTLLESVPNPVCYFDSAFRHSACNEAYARLLGLNREDILGKTLEETLYRDLSKSVELQSCNILMKKSDLDLSRGTRRQEYESRMFNHLTQTFRDVLVYREALYENEQFSGIMSIMTDITHIKSMNRFQEQLFDAIPNPVFFKDSSLVYSGMNQAFADWFCFSKSEMLGASWDSLLLSASRKFLDTDVGRFLDANKDSVREMFALVAEHDARLFSMPYSGPQMFEHRICNLKMREFRDVMFYRNGVYSDGGKFLGVVGSMLDVTELRTATRDNRSLIESMPFAFFRVYQGTVVQCNKLFLDMAGMNLSDAVGMSVDDARLIPYAPAEGSRLICAGAWEFEICNLARGERRTVVNYRTVVDESSFVSLYLDTSDLLPAITGREASLL